MLDLVHDPVKLRCCHDFAFPKKRRYSVLRGPVDQNRNEWLLRLPIISQKGPPFRLEVGIDRCSGSDEKDKCVSLSAFLIDALTPLLARSEIEGRPRLDIATAQCIFEPRSEICVLMGERKKDSHRHLHCPTASAYSGQTRMA